jgi:hypothetical protein
MVEWLAFLLRIREMPASNLGLDSGYPDEDFSWFYSDSPGECQDGTLNYTTVTSFQIISN